MTRIKTLKMEVIALKHAVVLRCDTRCRRTCGSQMGLHHTTHGTFGCTSLPCRVLTLKNNQVKRYRMNMAGLWELHNVLIDPSIPKPPARSNFCAITRAETLATQAISRVTGCLGVTRRPTKSSALAAKQVTIKTWPKPETAHEKSVTHGIPSQILNVPKHAHVVLNLFTISVWFVDLNLAKSKWYLNFDLLKNREIQKHRLQITREWQACVFPKFTLRLLPQFPFGGIGHEYSLRRIDSVENC